MPIRVNPADGVTAMDFVFDYDPDVVTPTGVYRTGYANGFSLAPDLGTSGTVRVTLASATPLAGAGDVAWVLFRILGAAGASTDLTWVSAQLNGGAVPAATQDGKVTVIAAPSRVSMPDDATGAPGAQVSVPVTVDPATGLDSFDFAVRFNPNVLRPVDVTKTALAAPLSLTYNVGIAGEVWVSLFGTEPLAGSGPLFTIRFEVVGGTADRTPFDVFEGSINEGRIPSALDDGLFGGCSPDDADGDGVSACGGDCDDANDAVSPGAPERCDGLDNNCAAGVDEGFDAGAPCTAGLGTCTRSGVVACSADGLSSSCDAVPGPPGTEDCDGLDDDCDGVPDNNIALPGAVEELAVEATAGGVRIGWPAVAGAQGYDLQRGGSAALLATGGAFDVAATFCLASDVTGTSVDDTAPTPAGDAAWYLARAANCAGPGTYDEAAGGQQGPRDAEISASGGACP